MVVTGRKKVYELARDLNIESKELLDKLKEIGIKVNSHMSTLTDEQVDFIKRKLAQPATLEIRRGDVIERRVRPTIIRRRKSGEEGGTAEQIPAETPPREKGGKTEI